MVIISDEIIDKLKRIAIHSDVTHQHAEGILIGKKLINLYCNKFSKRLSMENSFEKSTHAEINTLYSYLTLISPRNRKQLPINIVVIRVKNNILRKKNRRNRKTEFCLDEIYFFELPSKQIYCIFI